MIDNEVQPPADSPVPRSRRDRPPVAAVWRYAAGVGAAVIGLLPWLVTGMRLPVQNLWALPTPPEDMPLALLPFSQYAVLEIAALLVVGGALAGALARWRLPSGLGGVAVGLLAVQVLAVVQTAVTVHGGLETRTESAVYLGGLLALSALALAVSAGTMVLIARAPRAGVLVGVAVVALLLGPWLDAFLTSTAGRPPRWALRVSAESRFVVAPVLVGAAIAWTGLRTVGRAVAALGVLLALWLVPALFIGVTSAVGTRILARDPAGMLEYGLGVFRMAATSPDLVVQPLLVAVAVAAAGLLVGVLRRRTGST